MLGRLPGLVICKAASMPLPAIIPLHGNMDVFSAKSLEDTALSLVLGRAIAAAWRVGASSGLLPELRRELPDVREVDRMLRLVFSGASDPTNTWRARC